MDDDRIIEVMARAHMDRGVGPPDPKLLRRVKRSLADLREAGLVVVPRVPSQDAVHRAVCVFQNERALGCDDESMVRFIWRALTGDGK